MFITVILLVVTRGTCVGDNKETETSPLDSGGEPKGRRLLLNDPNTLLKEIEALQREMTSLKSHVTTVETEVTAQRTRIFSLESQLNSRNQQGVGSIYTVWGRKFCPAVNGTTTIYTGITAGGSYIDQGGAVDTLCLPHNPDMAPSDFPTRLESGGSYVGTIYGSEYQFTYRNYAQDDDVPCAVCSAKTASATMMLPAKVTCPDDWVIQYAGFLTSEHVSSDWRPSEYLCLHEDAEYLTEGSRQHNMNGRLFYPVKAVCGSLPCPPYHDGQYLTCVVCSQ